MAYGTLEGCIYWPMIGEVKGRRRVVYLFNVITFIQDSVTPCRDPCVLTARVNKMSDCGGYLTHEVS